jgi:probable rRNA maturation factor
LCEYAQAVLRELSITDWELSFLLADDDRTRELNSSYRGIDEPTDVLSFSADDDATDSIQNEGAIFPAGDIVLNLPMISRQAREWSVSPEEELRRVVIHGILHLAGHTHNSNDFSAEPMLRLQETILATLKERIY